MKGQSQTIVFILLFVISLILMLTAMSWGSDLSQKSIDISKVSGTEVLIKDLDSAIQSVARYGGSQTIDYRLPATIGISDVGMNDIIELQIPASVAFPEDWVNISKGYTLIKEKKTGDILFIQMSYPAIPGSGFAIDLYTEGLQKSQPRTVTIEKTGAYNTLIGSETFRVARVKITLN